MERVTARPAALAAFADEMLAVDAALQDRAQDLRATLAMYRYRNPDFGGDYSALADGLSAMSAELLDLDQHVGATAEAFTRLDQGGPVASGTQRAIDATYAELGQNITDLRDAVVPLPRELWWRLVYGSWECPDGLDGGYSGGGGIVGPGGRLYPLVIPELVIDGQTYHATRSGDPRFDPTTLGGTDPGWIRIATLHGVARISDVGATWAAQTVAGFAAASGGSSGNYRFADAAQLAQLRIDSSGWPSFPARAKFSGPPPAGPPPQTGDVQRQVLLQVEGELRMVDPTTIHEQPREVRRAFSRDVGDGYVAPGRPGVPPPRVAGAASGAADLVGGALRGVEVAQALDGANHAAYQLALEETLDGRRRAMARTYRVMSGPTGTGIDPGLVRLAEDGLQRTPMRIHESEGPSLGPTANSLPVLQRPE